MFIKFWNCLILFLNIYCLSWLLASVASGFCGFWLSWLLWFLWLLVFVAFVASVFFGFRGFCGFCGFLLFGLSIYLFIYFYLYLSIYIYLSFFIYSFLAIVLLSLFVHIFPVVCVAETKSNKQASKQARTAHLWIWCAAGGDAAPPQSPPATKSAFHPRHPRLPRNQYFKVNSPVQTFLIKQIYLLYLYIYRSIYLSIYLSPMTKYYTCHEICN